MRAGDIHGTGCAAARLDKPDLSCAMANRAPKWMRSVVEKQQTELTDRSKAVRMSSESASNAINRVIRNANSSFWLAVRNPGDFATV